MAAQWLPARHRSDNIAEVVQIDGLPHRNTDVKEGASFGLVRRGVERKNRASRSADAATVMGITSKCKRLGNPGEIPIRFADSQSRFDSDAIEARWTLENQHGNQARIFRHGVCPQHTIAIRPAEVAGRDFTTKGRAEGFIFGAR